MSCTLHFTWSVVCDLAWLILRDDMSVLLNEVTPRLLWMDL